MDVVESIIKQGIQLDLPEVCLDELVAGEPIEMVEMEKEPATVVHKIKAHGRQSSAGSLDLSFLFAPIRFPSLSWRRRNTVDEEGGVASGAVGGAEPEPEGATALQVAVEICPVPALSSLDAASEAADDTSDVVDC